MSLPTIGTSDSLLTADQAASLLKVNRRWLYRRIHSLPHIRVGSHLRFNQDALISHLQLVSRCSNVSRDENRQQVLERGVMKLGLRRYQRGYIYKDGKRKKVWRAMWRRDVYDLQGNLSRKRETATIGSLAEFPTLSDARRQLDKLMCLDMNVHDVDMTFSALVERWRLAERPTMRKSTGEYYERMLEKHLLPVFGQCRLSAVRRPDIQLFLGLRAKQYAHSSLRGMRSTLGKVMSWAEKCEWVKANPCREIPVPLGRPGRVRNVMSVRDAGRLVGELREPYASLVFFLSATGLRISEALGLRWSDFKSDGIEVSRRIYEGQVDELKSKSSKRWIPLGEDLRQRLLGLRDGSEYVFHSRKGTTLWRQNVMRRYIRPAAQKLGIPLTGFHDTRHGLLTRLAENKVSPRVAQVIAGHSDIRTTLKVYTHVRDEAVQSALQEVSDQLANDGKL